MRRLVLYPSVKCRQWLHLRKLHWQDVQMAFVNVSSQLAVRQLLTILIFLLCGSLALATNAEGELLLRISSSFSPKDAFHSWNVGLDDPCTWVHVSCNSDLRVVQLELSNLQLSGTLSRDIGSLLYLQTLILNDNSISNSIPVEVGNLTQLEVLDLHNNRFNGSIPKTLERLHVLHTLLLDHNNLDGLIPSWLGNISNWDMSYNNFHGKVPDGFSYSRVSGNENICGAVVSNQCPGDPPLAAGSSKHIVLAGVLAVCLIVCFLAPLTIWCRRRLVPPPVFFDVTAEDDPEAIYGQLKKYSLSELRTATDDFHEKNIIGRGGFGKVYKGVFPDGTEIAVKRLADQHISNTSKVKETFKKEVDLISLAMHRHVLRLKGFCITHSEWLLVYPYMPNRCVASCLKERADDLNWPTRQRIALGTARGIEYLHDLGDGKTKIIHRDIKAANVLLDDKYEALVGDFGFAKLQESNLTHVTTHVCGTRGFIAPEYLSSGRSSEKIDVFSYGVFLLELITGKGVCDLARLQDDDEFMLSDYVRKRVEEREFDQLVDESLGQDYSIEQVEEMLKLALLCTQTAPEKRPKMAEVVHMLEGGGVAAKWESERQDIEMQPGMLYEFEYNSVDCEELTGPR